MAISTNPAAAANVHSSSSATVSCPKCGSAIPITEALSHQAREQVTRDFELKRQEMDLQFAQREQKLQAERAEIETARTKISEELAGRLEKEKAQLATTMRKEFEAQKGHELTALQEQLARKNKLVEEATEKQLELMRQKAALEEKERSFKLELQGQLDAAKSKAQAEAAARLEKEKAALLARAREEFASQQGNELAALKQQLDLRKKQVDDANAKELALLKEKALLEDEKRNLGLQVARQLEAERAKVAEQARAEVLEESRLKLAEKDKQADDLRHQIETLRQKATQGSIQAQGEILELDFEAKLRAEFPFDDISPIGTGQRGADVRQVVCTSPTNPCGTILWEAKRTRTWSNQWIAKLKGDQRDAKAELAVIVTQALPKDVGTFGCVDGIWVTDYASALPLAYCLRHGLLTTSAARQAETGKFGKAEELYALLTSTEFRQQVEGIVEAFKAMSADLESERAAMERIWKKRENQLRNALRSTARLYGGVQQVLGAAALPDVASLALPSGD